MTTPVFPIHTGSPVFLDALLSVSPGDCAWARTEVLKKEMKEAGGIPIDDAAGVIAAYKGEPSDGSESDPTEAVIGHEPAEVTFEGEGLRRIARVTCRTCTQIINICGPATPGNQSPAMNRPAPEEAGCVVWAMVPDEFPLES